MPPSQNKPTPLDADALSTIRAQYPDLPGDYLAFLRDVGFGGIGGKPDSPLFMLYSGPVPPSDIYGEELGALDERYVLFGDDYTGNAAAFDVNGQVVMIFHEDHLIEFTAQSFTDFVAQLGLGEA